MNILRPPLRSRRRYAGTVPGSLTANDAATATVEFLQWSHDGVREWSQRGAGSDTPIAIPEVAPDEVLWVNVIGVDNGAVISTIGRAVGMHPLTMEDVQHTDQRPKLESTSETLFAVVRMLTPASDDAPALIAVEQVSIFARGRIVVSFQQRPGDLFDPIRERIRSGAGRVRTSGPDYFAYALLDAIVDATLDVAELVHEEIERVEERILSGTESEDLRTIRPLRSAALTVRHTTRPLRQPLAALIREEGGMFVAATQPFLRDLLDHVLLATDTAEAHMERISGLVQLHAAMVGMETNRVMRTLTIIATIFIPLTFVAGVYGMNFQVMPELAWRWGYPTVVGVMAVIALGMVRWFRRRRWL